MAGQVVMQGFLELRIPLWVRRAATMAPALLVIGLGVNPTRTLVLSPSRAEPCPAFRGRAAGRVLEPQALDGSARQPAPDHGRRGRDRHTDRRRERLPAMGNLLRELTAMFKHLLLPLDGTATAERVIPVARGLAQASEARITLLHVIEVSLSKEKHGQAHLQDKDSAEAYLRALVAREFSGLPGVDWHVYDEAARNVAKSLALHAQEFQPESGRAVCPRQPMVEGSLSRQLGPAPLACAKGALTDQDPGARAAACSPTSAAR